MGEPENQSNENYDSVDNHQIYIIINKKSIQKTGHAHASVNEVDIRLMVEYDRYTSQRIYDMNEAEYEQLSNITKHPLLLHISELADQSDRTLLYGYNLDGAGTVHVYVKDCKLNILIYNHDQHIMFERCGSELKIEDMIPSKRAFPERCDYHFCELVMEYGFKIPFTTFQKDVEPAQYYGKTLYTLNPTPDDVVRIRKISLELQTEIEKMLMSEDLMDKIKDNLWLNEEDEAEKKAAFSTAMELFEPLRKLLIAINFKNRDPNHQFEEPLDFALTYKAQRAEILRLGIEIGDVKHGYLNSIIEELEDYIQEKLGLSY